MRQHTRIISRKRVIGRILHFYDKGVKHFFEVFARQSSLSHAMADLGYEVSIFNLTSGWNFEKADRRLSSSPSHVVDAKALYDLLTKDGPSGAGQ